VEKEKFKEFHSQPLSVNSNRGANVKLLRLEVKAADFGNHLACNHRML